jgi:ABC-type multidrug transport system fused ATPase/permease subunit
MSSTDREKIKGASLREVFSLIPRGKRRGAAGVTLASALLAVLDFIGMAALIPVLLMVLNEDIIFTNATISRLYEALGFTSQNGFVIAVCLAVLSVMVLKSVFSIVVVNAMRKYQLSLFRYYSTRMFDIYLSKGLLFIRGNHTSQLINNVNGICLRFADGVIGSLFEIVSDTLLLSMIVTALLIYDPLLVLLAAAVFVPLAVVYSRIFNRRMIENGREENRLFVAQNKTLYETLRGYSDIEINNAEKYVSGKFRKGLKTLSEYRRKAGLVRMASGRVTEFSLILGVVAMIIIGLSIGKDMSSLAVSLGVFAFAAYKIVPSVSRIVNSWVEYKRNSYAAETIRATFREAPRIRFDSVSTARLPFEKEIAIENISFAYEGGRQVLDNFSLTIKKGEKIGIRGYSGAGKTTLFNIICGFFEPDSGAIRIDGAALTPENRREWQNNLACVSQDVFIPDATIAENIAFGMERSDIDEERLRKAISTASLDEFVRSLPDGVDTVTGESGCRVSGGQRQRIGIARALYKEASVLLFDEATSSLDNKTEEEIVRAIEKLSADRSDLTMLIISHRDRTLTFCDRVIEINGQPATDNDGKCQDGK